MNLRMTGLTAVVVLTALLPLAASAGQAEDIRSDPAALLLPDASPEDAPPRDSRPAEARPADAPLSADANADGKPGAASGSGAGGYAGVGHGAAGSGASRTTERCGPEVVSPEGIEAQTCVLATGHETWARTYHDNATGDELMAVLSLMGPGGRILQTRCVVGDDQVPSTCETPRERSGGTVAGYSAVVEFAAPDDAGSGPLLLRSATDFATNSGHPAGR